MATLNRLERITDTLWQLPLFFKPGMHVPRRIYSTEKIIRPINVNKGDVISPGGIGFDINYGMRLVKTLLYRLFKQIPTGVGSSSLLKISRSEFRQICRQGAHWYVDHGLSWKEDLELTEEEGMIAGAYSLAVQDRELGCTPFHSPESQDYFAAMKCTLNMSFANRKIILYRVREVFSKVLDSQQEI